METTKQDDVSEVRTVDTNTLTRMKIRAKMFVKIFRMESVLVVPSVDSDILTSSLISRSRWPSSQPSSTTRA